MGDPARLKPGGHLGHLGPQKLVVFVSNENNNLCPGLCKMYAFLAELVFTPDSYKSKHLVPITFMKFMKPRKSKLHRLKTMKNCFASRKRNLIRSNTQREVQGVLFGFEISAATDLSARHFRYILARLRMINQWSYCAK